MNTSSQRSTARAAFAAAVFMALSFAAPQVSADAAQPNAEPSYLKDLDIRQRPMATTIMAPVPESAPRMAAQELAVKTAVDRSDARYTHGDSLELSVEVTEDAYVWVFDTGTSGKVHLIFPNRYEADNFVRANAPVSIPGEGADYQLLVSHPKGVELITVIASTEDMPLTQDLIDRETQAGPFFALRGNAASVAKDLSISLKKAKAKGVAHQLVYIE